MRILILNDGTQHEIYRCGASEGVLWIGLSGETAFLPVVTVFGNAEKTEVLTSTYDSEGAHRTVYEGYTQLINLLAQDEGVLIALKKGAQT